MIAVRLKIYVLQTTETQRTQRSIRFLRASVAFDLRRVQKDPPYGSLHFNDKTSGFHFEPGQRPGTDDPDAHR